MRAPASRHSRMMSVVAVAVEDHRGDVAHALAERLGDRFEVGLHRRVEVDHVGRERAGRDLLHVDARAGVEHRAPLAERDHRDRARAAERRERGAVDRVDRDVHRGGGAVADLLAVEEHRRFVLLALADHDDAVHRDAVEHDAHRLDRGAVGGVLVAAAHPPAAGERGGLGGAHELHREVAIRALLSLHRVSSAPSGRATLVGRPQRVGERPVRVETSASYRGGSRHGQVSTARSRWSPGRRRGSGSRASPRFVQEGARVVGLDLAEPQHELDVPPGAPDVSFVHGRRARRGRDRGRGRRRRSPSTAGSTRSSPRPASPAAVPRISLDRDEWQRVLDINLTGTFLVCKHAIARMLEQQLVDGERGSLVTIASVEGLEGTAGGSSYNASKGAVVIFTKNLAIDYGRVRHPRQRDLPRLHRDADARRRVRHARARRACAITSGRSTSCAGSAGPRRSRRWPRSSCRATRRS